MKRLVVINQKENLFVALNFFVCEVKEKILHITYKEGLVEIPVNRLKFYRKIRNYSNDFSWAFNSTNYGEKYNRKIGNCIVQYPQLSAYLPDIIFENEYVRNKFYKFLKNYAEFDS